MDNQKTTNQECCPKFDPAPWDGKVLEWDTKQFIKAKIFTVFYMPINMGSVITRNLELLHNAHATCPDWLVLSDHTSKWNMDIYVAVDKEVPGIENITLSGKYYCNVYEGNFRDVGKWSKDFEEHVKKKGMSIRKQYMWYTTCPKCAKKWGKNYTVIVGKVE